MLICFTINLLEKFAGFEFQGIDGSWVWALNQLAVEPQTVLGTYPAFTYGPLGYLFQPLNYGNNLFWAAVFNIFWAAIFIGLFVVYIVRNGAPGRSKLLVFLLLWFFCTINLSYPNQLELAMLFGFMLVWQNRDHKKLFICLVVIMSLLSALSLFIKFSTFMSALAAAGTLGLALLFTNRRRFLLYLGVYALVAVVACAILIPSFYSGFTAFLSAFKNSVLVAGGFNTGMTLPTPLVSAMLGLVMPAAFLIVLYLAYKKERNYFWCLFILMPAFLFFFKYGFVLSEEQHITLYFSLMPQLMGFIFLFAPRRLMGQAFTAFILSIVCLFIILKPAPAVYLETFIEKRLAANLTYIAKYQYYKEFAVELKQKRFASYVLPEDWNTLIGDNSIQIFPGELNYAGINNWSGWRPNGVLQAYSAYTPTLDAYSARSLMGAEAPRFVLARFEFLGRKNPYIDTPLTFTTIFNNYKMVKNKDRVLLLMQKDAVNKYPEFRQYGEPQYFELNQWIDVPDTDGLLFAAADFNVSIYGKILTAVFKAASTDMVVLYSDGTMGVYWIVPANLRNPFLVNHIPATHQQLISLFADAGPPDVKVVKIRFENTSPVYFKKNIKITWQKLVKD